MKNEEQLGPNDRSKLEERIIAHFDGSLDDASSKRLIDEVMASPEKRALFRAHETLNRVIASARVPMEAPLETRREIAEKIPGLVAFIPGLIGTASTAPVIQQAVNPILAFFTRMSLTTAVSIGGAVAVLTTIGIIASNNTGNNSNLNGPKSAYVQEAAPSASTQASTRNFAVTPSTVNSAVQSSARSTARSHADISSISRHARSIIRSSQPISSKPAISEPTDVENEMATSVSDNNAPGNEPVSQVPPIVNPNMEPKPTAPAVADIPMQKGIMTQVPDEVNQAIKVKPYAAYGITALQLDGFTGRRSYYGQTSTLGLEFDLGDRWTFHAQGGTSYFAQVQAVADNHGSITSLIGTINAYAPDMVAKQAPWGTVGMTYSFATPIAPIIVGGDAGVAFTHNAGILAGASVATEFSIADHFAVRPAINYSMVWNSSVNPINSYSGLYEGANVSSMWANSLGFQLNFVYQY